MSQKMDLKSLILITLCFLLAAYVLFVKVQEQILISESSCKSNSCVRFCHGSNLTININKNTTFDKLRSGFLPITNKFCEEASIIENGDDWMFLENGHIHFMEDDSTLEWYQYCLQYHNEKDYTLYECLEDTASEKIRENYPYFMLMSVPFLIISIIIYSWIPQLRNLSGRCLLCYIISVLILYVGYAFSLIFKEWISEHEMFCEVTGYVQFMTFLMCFLWLNVLCYDVWSTVRKIYNIANRYIFLKYCVYGFGVPIITTFLIFILNKHEILSKSFRHHLGEDKFCFIGGEKNVEIIYKVIPLTIMLSINAIFFALTAITIFKTQQQSARLKSIETDRYLQTKQRFLLYFRLFVIMGMTWVAEAVSYFVEPNLFLNAISIINCLQGVLIFIHFIWRSRVQKSIRKKTETSNTMATTENL